MSVVERWKAAAFEEVQLPSGVRVRGIRPAPSEIVRRQIVPGVLRQAVLKARAKAPKEWNDEDHAAEVESRRHLLSAFLREGWNEEKQAWEPLTLTVDELAQLPPRDLELLDDFILRRKTAQQIKLVGDLMSGTITAAEAVEAMEREAGDTVDGWESFRGQQRGSAAGPAGERVAGPAGNAGGDNRAARRARGKRRAVPAPAAGEQVQAT